MMHPMSHDLTCFTPWLASSVSSVSASSASARGCGTCHQSTSRWKNVNRNYRELGVHEQKYGTRNIKKLYKDYIKTIYVYLYIYIYIVDSCCTLYEVNFSSNGHSGSL